ncbi:hypothetical protein AB685_15425 [Bacillus sp. LL01]|nr:hypothetical protein AB685_15425 [Bacillus sp. LL01]
MFLFIIGNYFHEEPKLQVEMIAFNELTAEERSRILVSPKDSSVQEMTVDEELASQLNTVRVGASLYKVIFNHTQTDSKGNLFVYVDMEREEVVGKGNVGE